MRWHLLISSCKWVSNSPFSTASASLFRNFFPNIEKVKIIIMTRVPKERTPSYKMGDALDSWVDLAKECSPVRCDDNIDHVVITNPPVIKLVVNITSPAVIKQVIITNKPSVLQVAAAFWWVARLPGHVEGGAGWDKLQVVFRQIWVPEKKAIKFWESTDFRVSPILTRRPSSCCDEEVAMICSRTSLSMVSRCQ